MKRDFISFLIAAITMIAASCSTDNSFFGSDDIDNGTPSGGSTSGENLSTGELATFTIAIDTTAFSESETLPSTSSDEYEDYVESFSAASTIYINYNGKTASYSGNATGVSVNIENADVTVTSTAKGINYVLSGTTTEGSFKVASSDNNNKFQLTLNGVNINNTDGPAINIQSGKRCYVTLADGTTNILSDGTSYTESTEDQKATMFGEGELLFNGKGKLRIYANTKAGICSDDYVMFRPGNNVYVKSTAGNGIKGNDGVIVKGGVINIETTSTAAKALTSDGFMEIDGGRTIAITTGSGEYDSTEKDCSGSAGAKSDSTFVMNGGKLYCKSTGNGGKGISSDQALTINGGDVKVITTGTKYSSNNSSTSPKGIKSDSNININGGSVMVRTTGGEGSEGIESKTIINLAGGTTEVYAYDDAINASSKINISGGYVYAYASNNDGIDSNGTLNISGGVAVSSGTTQPEEGFDCDQNTFTVTGGTLVGIGGGTSTPTSSVTKQPVAIIGGSSLSSGTYITVATSSGTNLFAFKVPRSYSQYTLLISSPDMKQSSSYIVNSGATVSGGTSFNGYTTGATVSGGSTIASLTLSSMVTTYNYSGGMGGGNVQPRW